MTRTGFRAVLALVFVAGTIFVIAAPAAAATPVVVCKGTCGNYQVFDNNTNSPGARCRYDEVSPYMIHDIDIRSPLMYGHYPNKTRVGWAFVIQWQANGGGKWQGPYITPPQAASASNSASASQGNGFKGATWQAPAHPSGYHYRVRVVLYWWHNNAIEGTARIQYDWYRKVRGATSTIAPHYCLQSY